MARRTVWLRRDPVGAHTRLPSRDDFRARRARSGFVSAAIAIAALAILVVLRALPRLDGAWNSLLAIAFLFGIAGVGAAAIAMRSRRLRGQALAGLVISLAALVGALFIDSLVDVVA
jgi:Zn-dependent protease